uniref:Uncharacterized protein n=1 Tax=Photinus pyralis TaxID=7054 RepID=A0A1Y1NHK4_PHOPY
MRLCTPSKCSGGGVKGELNDRNSRFLSFPILPEVDQNLKQYVGFSTDNFTTDMLFFSNLYPVGLNNHLNNFEIIKVSFKTVKSILSNSSPRYFEAYCIYFLNDSIHLIIYS